MSRGHIYKRGSRWTIVYETEPDIIGNRRQKSKGGFSTKKEAQTALSQVLHDQERGSYVEPSQTKLGEFLRDWLSSQQTRLAGTTLEGYRVICQAHLIPALGQVPLAKLTALSIERYYNKQRRKPKPLSERTLLHHHRLLKKALSRAVQLHYVVRNPVDSVEAPKPQRAAMHALDPAQTASLRKMFKGTQWQLMVLTSVATGLRRGEVLALCWDDIDLDQGFLRVKQALEQTRAGLRVKEPKTKSSRRKIALSHFLVQELRRHRVQQMETRLKVGAEYNDRGIVFASSDGDWISPDSYTAAFRYRVKGTEFGKLRLHDLRHTHASQLLLTGTHPKVVSERLGHSSIAITLDTYSHLLPGIDEEAAQRIDEVLGSLLK